MLLVIDGRSVIGEVAGEGEMIVAVVGESKLVQDEVSICASEEVVRTIICAKTRFRNFFFRFEEPMYVFEVRLTDGPLSFRLLPSFTIPHHLSHCTYPIESSVIVHIPSKHQTHVVIFKEECPMANKGEACPMTNKGKELATKLPTPGDVRVADHLFYKKPRRARRTLMASR